MSTKTKTTKSRLASFAKTREPKNDVLVNRRVSSRLVKSKSYEETNSDASQEEEEDGDDDASEDKDKDEDQEVAMNDASIEDVTDAEQDKENIIKLKAKRFVEVQSPIMRKKIRL